MKKIAAHLIIFAAFLLLAGCAAKVQYHDAQETQAVTTDFSSTDLQLIAEKMVDSLITFPPIVQLTEQRRPVLLVEQVKNKTMQHIDTEAITDTVRTRLIRSGKFRFIDRTTDDAAIREISTQQDGGLVDPNKAIQFGHQLGAEYILTGNFAEIQQKAGGVKDVYYKFTLNLKNLRTGILEWSDEKEIRKVWKRSLFGG
jgi:hypothetical protein